MTKIKLLILLIISTFFISCGNLEPYKKILSVEDKQTENIRLTTYEDGTTKVENLGFMKMKERQEREDRKKDKR
ncbi:MAG: hypothetical protein WBG30_06155 [Psychrilyobacter sp.]|uniref:hypothetical protein n=1 Tax=Psychrilyobacter sp. TaxID=2586924 RepID=UPI003C763BFD